MLAAALDLGVSVEGVETADEVRQLRELGCAIGQGYHLGRPLDAAAIRERLLANPTASGCDLSLTSESSRSD